MKEVSLERERAKSHKFTGASKTQRRGRKGGKAVGKNLQKTFDPFFSLFFQKAAPMIPLELLWGSGKLVWHECSYSWHLKLPNYLL